MTEMCRTLGGWAGSRLTDNGAKPLQHGSYGSHAEKGVGERGRERVRVYVCEREHAHTYTRYVQGFSYSEKSQGIGFFSLSISNCHSNITMVSFPASPL